MTARLAIVLLALAAPAAAAQRQGLLPLGNPGALVEVDSSLAHRARDRGAANALIAFAEDSAEVIAGQPAPLRAWLKGHDAAPWFAARRTEAAYAACDGTAGITTGSWRDGGFALVWHRQKALDYRWVLAAIGPAPAQSAHADWITGKLADCPPRDADAAPGERALPAPLPPLPGATDRHDGRSQDGSLVWTTARAADGAALFAAWLWQDGAWHRIGGQG